MKLKRTKVATFAATLITFGSLVGGANSAVIVIWQQDGLDVTATWSGSLFVDTLTDTTRDAATVSRDFASNNALLHIETDGSGLGFYVQSIGGATVTSINLTIDILSGESLASFGFSGSELVWNDVHINSGVVGNVGVLSFDPSRDIIRFSNTDLSTMGADSFSNTVAWTENVTGDSILYTTVASSVPEPSSILLLGIGTLGILGRRRRS